VAPSLGGPDLDALAKGVVADSSGSAYVVGQFEGTVAFDEEHTLVSDGYSDQFLWRLAPSGETVWLHHVRSIGPLLGSEVEIDEYGRVIFAGGIRSHPAYFPDGLGGERELLSPDNSPRVYVVRYNPDGHLVDLLFDEASANTTGGELARSGDRLYLDVPYRGPGNQTAGSTEFFVYGQKDIALVAIDL